LAHELQSWQSQINNNRDISALSTADNSD